MVRLSIKKSNMILTEKQQKYQHYLQVKLIDNEYLAAKEILPSDQSRIIEQAKCTYSPLGNAFEKQIKAIKEQGKKKEVEALEVL